MFGKAVLLFTMFIALSGVLIVAFASSDVNTNKQVISSPCLPVSNQISGQTYGNNLNQLSPRTVSASSNVKTKSKGHIISRLTAKLLAKKFIKQPGARPGTPKLVKYNNKRVYIVPVIQHRIKVGEIDIDAKNGNNLGGAGGAPSK
ncbi:MAG: peptidase propeptide domain-containing protein [Methanobacterium sp. ERen5]|nr:MAG: peptidase propeptide domain-containing protein [Methanobacterium sp. ERen5]